MIVCTEDRLEQCEVMNASEKEKKPFLERYLLQAQGRLGL